MAADSSEPGPAPPLDDPATAAGSVVAVRCSIPEDALTAAVLGTERSGSGTVIGADGLIVTVGYLVNEAEELWVTTAGGTTSPGHLVGYDPDSGLGVVQALQPLGVPPVPLGDSRGLKPSDPVVVAGFGDGGGALDAQVIARHEFAGYWEYLLDEAIFTAPAHENWGGAAALAADGRLVGVASLLVQVSSGADTSAANMLVPIDLLEATLPDLLRIGRPDRPARPWLGMFVHPADDDLVVAGVYDGCPADRAGVRPGDVVLDVAGRRPDGLAGFLRHVWSLGPAGVEVPLRLQRDDGEARQVAVASMDRLDAQRGRRLH